MKIKLTPKMQEIAEFYKDLGNVYFVGGCLRDLIMNKEPHDYDLATDKTPDEVRKYIKSKGSRCFELGPKFGTLGCKIPPSFDQIEITTFRSETYDFKSRKPKVIFTKKLDEDLGRRDFTINALACDLNGNLKGNYQQALDDINNKVLKCVGNSKLRLQEDPLRILRGIRLAAKYNLSIDIKTLRRLETCRWELIRLSKERIIDEINKILLLDTQEVMFALENMWKLKTWQIIDPIMQLQFDFDQNSPHHDFKLHEHTMRLIKAIKEDDELKDSLPHLWAGLKHDKGKPILKTLHKSGERCNYINHEILGAELTEDFCRKYKFSNKDREFIVKSVRNHIKDDCWMKPFDNKGKKNV